MRLTVKYTKTHPWTGVAKYKGCYDHIGPYITRNGYDYSGNLSPKEARELEVELGYPEGHLSPGSEFWNRFGITVKENGSTIDTGTPLGKLQWLYVKNHKRVANGYADLRPFHDFVLIDDEYEAKEKNRLNKVRRDAAKEFDKMSIEDMRKALRLYGYKSDTMSNELIESKLYDLIEKNPRDFFTKWVDNNSKETEFLIEAAISKNIIRKNKNTYYYGTDVIGVSKDDTVAYLDDKNNSDIKKSILNEIESK